MQPDENDNLHIYFARAEQAFASGDMRATGILLNQVLLREFTHKQAWRILHALYGADQAFEVFQYKFTRQNYPNNLHLLTTIPGWISEVEPGFFTAGESEKPALGSKPRLFHSHQSPADRSGSNVHQSPAGQAARAKSPATHQPIFPAVLFKYRGIFMLALLLLFMPVIYFLAGARHVKISTTIPAHASIAPTLTALPSGTQPAAHQAPVNDPVELIRAYTNAINTHNYAAAWASLSPDFIKKMSAQLGHPYTYADDYVTSWNKLSSLEILAASTESSDPQSASMLLKLRWNMTNGETPLSNQRFHLIRNANSSAWLIDAIETLK